jgi:hypothetical protein
MNLCLSASVVIPPLGLYYLRALERQCVKEIIECASHKQGKRNDERHHQEGSPRPPLFHDHEEICDAGYKKGQGNQAHYDLVFI